MEINADFSRRVAVHAARLPWVSSPMAGSNVKFVRCVLREDVPRFDGSWTGDLLHLKASSSREIPQ